MKAKQHKEITITLDEKEAGAIRDFLYWLDSTTIPDEVASPMMNLHTVLCDTLDAEDPVALYDMVLKRKIYSKK
mgnify:CR=1 FL=1